MQGRLARWRGATFLALRKLRIFDCRVDDHILTYTPGLIDVRQGVFVHGLAGHLGSFAHF